ncbi:MAG: hypothetical protein IPP31_04830 [Chitinophagaceae bacterium]|nr:hypothetical protein [Chitinophagaceae bacterium]
MSRKIVGLFLIGTGFLLNACQKDTDVFVPDPGQTNGPDTNWYASIAPTMPVNTLKNALTFGVYTDSIQVNNSNAYVLTPFGLQCGFPPNCCTGASGQAITGTVTVELMLIKKKGDMIRLNRPTVSNGRLLISGGEIYIRMKKNGQEVQLAPNVRITLRYPDAPIFTQMKLFIGDESVPNLFNWLPSPDLPNNTVTVTSQQYEIQTNQLRWLNNAYFADTNGLRTKISATLAPQFTNANSMAFAVFKDFRSVVALGAEVSARQFTSIKLPVGKEFTLVVISRQGNDYFMGHTTTMTASPAANTTFQPVSVNPVITNMTNIINYLNTL